MVHQVCDGAVLYNKPGKRITGKSVEGVFRKVRDRLEANSAVIGVIGGIAGTIAAVTTGTESVLAIDHREASGA